MKKLAFGGLLVVALGLGALAVYRGQPAPSGATAGPGGVSSALAAATPRPAALNSGEPGGVVKYLKPCNDPCVGTDGQAVQRYTVEKRDGDCNPECFTLRAVAEGAPCLPNCFMIVDSPDGTCEYKLTLPAGAENQCPPHCERANLAPCMPNC